MTNAIKTPKDARRVILETATKGSSKMLRDARLLKGKTWAIRQGDLSIVRVGDFKPAKKGSKPWGGSPLSKNQLVNDSSEGSKHSVAQLGKTPLKVTILDTSHAGEYPCSLIADQRIDGPVILADSEWALTHGDHAHYAFPAGNYRVIHQLDASTMQAVRD